MDKHTVGQPSPVIQDEMPGAPDWLRQAAARVAQHPSQYPSDDTPAIAAPAARTRPAAGIPWPPGYMGRLAQLFHESSIRPVKEVSITTALGVMAGICGHNWTTPTGAGLNLYIALVARSAIGKEAMSEGVNMVMNAALNQGSMSARDFFMFEEMASGPALVKNLKDKTSVLLVEGEFGHKVKFMSIDKSGPFATLRGQLTKLYSKSGVMSAAGGIAYSNRDNDVKLSGGRVAFSLVGDTTPGTFYEALSSSMMADGFLSRFLIIEYDGDRPPENENRIWPDSSFAGWASGLIFSAAQARPPMPVDWSSESWEMRKAFERECDQEVNSTDDESRRQLWSRAGLKVMKIACLLAVADNYAAPQVSVEHMNWALDLVRRNILLMGRRLDTGDIGTDDDARERKLVRIFRDFLTEPLKPSYKIPEAMRENGIIPRSYIQIRVAKSPAFYNYLGKEGNTVLAIDHTVQSCVNQGYLMEVDKLKVAEAYNYHGRAYRILRLPDYAALAKG